jgi:hypothetical protein
MRRSRCARLLTGLLTVWLALTQSDVAVLHAWPASGHAPAAAPAACIHHSAATHDHDHHAPAGNDDAQRCSCCCACVAPALVSTPAAVVALVPIARFVAVQPPAPAVVAYHPTAPAHARPPSLAPPTRSA